MTKLSGYRDAQNVRQVHYALTLATRPTHIVMAPAHSITQPEFLLSVAEEISEFGCFSWNIRDDSLEWSDGLLKLYGIERDGFNGTGADFFERIHPEDRKAVSEALQEAVQNVGVFSNTERIVRPDGEIRWLQSRGRLSVNAQGEPVQLVGVCHDITEQVAHANEKRRQIDDHKFLESQLLQMQKIEAIGKLTTGIAHDFNNLMTIVISGCELLALLPADSMADDARELLRSIEEAGDRAGQLTQQLLAYSRSSERQLQSVDLNQAVRESEQFLNRTLGGSIRLSVSLHPNAPMVRIDPVHLQQTLLNLAVNARDAMPTGGELSIKTDVIWRSPVSPNSANSSPVSHALLQFTDNGTGVSNEVRAHMFDPFFTTKPVGSGSGLGLSVVEGIVHATGGFIELDTNAGQGMQFRIFLPTSPNEASTNQPANPAKLSQPAEAQMGRKRTILIVEDEPAVLQVIDAAYQQAGYRTILQTDPVEAVRMVNQAAQPIDLLITDVSMPVLSGPELLQLIQGDETDSPFPVLFMSGNDDNVLLERYGISSDSQDFIRKPFRIADLIRSTEKALNANSAIEH